MFKNEVFKIKINNIILFLFLFTSFILWDVKNFYFDLRFLSIFFIGLFFVLNIREIKVEKNFLIFFILLFILFHYFIISYQKK